ncbi:hypothetical protein D1007_41541 [Hordeum vulgare]|nr:hypothetical protein D1007_41541 [Hordeum vulgare]
MSEATREGGPSHLRRAFPEDIFVGKILVRLPPKTLLRCRAVCRAWRAATSTREFLLAHHAHQPALPLLSGYDEDAKSLDVIHFDHRAGVAADGRLQSVARLGHTYFRVEASCDGLLVISSRNEQLGVCNPATRQYVPLWGFSGFTLMGMYPHAPTGEIRLIYQHLDPAAASQNGCYIFALGAGQPPRHVGYWAGRVKLMSQRALLFRGCLHWYRQQLGNQMNIIVVFDTIDESFRLMRAPVVPGRADLFEMDGMLGMSSFNDAATIIHIWVLRDYESKAWTFKCRIELPVKEIRARCENHDDRCDVVVLPRDGKLLVLVKFSEWCQIVLYVNLQAAPVFKKSLSIAPQIRGFLLSHFSSN